MAPRDSFSVKNVSTFFIKGRCDRLRSNTFVPRREGKMVMTILFIYQSRLLAVFTVGSLFSFNMPDFPPSLLFCFLPKFPCFLHFVVEIVQKLFRTISYTSGRHLSFFIRTSIRRGVDTYTNSYGIENMP